ncbi:MAG: hypothetical protein KAY37_09670 [Phycisphaerae bacterium]|nr:hypothetical protein [Phycisphaerae bacterium]
MRARVLITTMAVLALSVGASADPTATLTLTSTQSGETVAPSDPIDWAVYVEASTGDNFGLALICCDLVQDAGNPAMFDIPPGDALSIADPMDKFNRPAGISNPGEGGEPSGYIGVQRGDAGSMNLIQLGGAQNTFGAAGTTMGQVFDYNPLVGQSGPQLVLSGLFNAPATDGVYTFRLENGIANVLDANDPPNFTPVSPATVDVSGASFTFTVGPSICLGDSNCDDEINWRDIDYFVAAQNDNQAAWEAMFLPGTPTCSFWNNDVNGDGTANWRDIDPFVAVMNTTCP